MHAAGTDSEINQGGEFQVVSFIYVTGFAKMCIVHTSDFSTLKIHKICLDNWIYFKFVRKLDLLFFYYSYKFQVCILLLLDVMIL